MKCPKCHSVYYASQVRLDHGYPNDVPLTPLNILIRFVFILIILTLVGVILSVLNYRINTLIIYSLAGLVLSITFFSLKDSVLWYRKNKAGDCPKCDNSLKIRYWTG